MELRSNKRNAQIEECHGFHLSYKMRARGGGGDLCVIDKSDGERLFSVVALKRKLGMPVSETRPATASGRM